MKYWFIVHDDESYSKHPDLIGFFAKMSLNGSPIRDSDAQIIPDNALVNQVKVGDRVVYYTRGDYLIRGTFRVKDKLAEDDHRRAKEWKSSVGNQFEIEPLFLPKKEVDFRNIIFSGKQPLAMFKHLANLKRQWSMSIGGKNYIKEIPESDYKIIEAAIKETYKETKIKEEIPVQFPRKHLEVEFKLVKVLTSYGYKIHVATNDKYKIKDKGEEVLETIPEFHNERVCEITSRIDCVAFNNNNVPQVAAELVDSKGTLTESLFRLNELALAYPRSSELRFYIVGQNAFKQDFDEKLNSLTFKNMSQSNANCSFLTYDQLNEMYDDVIKPKRKL